MRDKDYARNNNLEPAHLQFKTHAFLGSKLGVDDKHVIVDQEMYELVVNYLRVRKVTVGELINVKCAEVAFNSTLFDPTILMRRNEKYQKLLLQEPLHDVHTCAALKEYDEACKSYDKALSGLTRAEIREMKMREGVSGPSMFYYAEKYGVTVKAMKDHWPCIPDSSLQYKQRNQNY